MSSQDTKKVLAALDGEQNKVRQDAQSEVSVLKEQLSKVEAKLQKLLDIYLGDALSTEEYAAKKQSLLSQKMSLSEKITDFETKGLSWLEPAREFVKSLNQAANLLSSPNPTAMTTFLKNIGSNHILQNRQLIFSPRIPYDLVAERNEANTFSLQFPKWCPQEESNPYIQLRRLMFYPLNYGGKKYSLSPCWRPAVEAGTNRGENNRNFFQKKKTKKK